jgi:hypothetical protein
MISKYRCVIGVTAGLSILLSGCGGGVFKDDILTGTALWTRVNIKTYSYTVEPHGFMLPQKYTVDVHSDGSSTVTPQGDTPPPGQPPVFKSMDSLYTHLDDVRKAGGRVRVAFDPTDGHILNCYVDPILQAADDEVGYVISDFKVQ